MIDILTYVQLAVFTAYSIIIVALYGILETISISYYRLRVSKEINSNHRHWFNGLMWSLAILLLFITNEKYGQPYWWLLFITSIFLALLGAAGDYRIKLIGTVHNIAAAGAIIFGILSIILCFHSYWIAAIILCWLAIFQWVWKVDNRVYWQENIAVYGITLGITL